MRRIYLVKRIKGLEEINKRGHQQFLPARRHRGSGRERNKRSALLMHLVFQGFDTTARQFYVRIQKERVASSNLQAALFERPKLAAPAVGQRRAFDDSKIGVGKLARHGRGAVIGSIV